MAQHLSLNPRRQQCHLHHSCTFLNLLCVAGGLEQQGPTKALVEVLVVMMCVFRGGRRATSRSSCSLCSSTVSTKIWGDCRACWKNLSRRTASLSCSDDRLASHGSVNFTVLAIIVAQCMRLTCASGGITMASLLSSITSLDTQQPRWLKVERVLYPSS